jgi:RNA polymerase sigma-70 factor (ECF subfamily)
MDNTDRNLIDAHCQGNKTAFTELVCRYGEGLFGYLIRMSGNRDQAEDLVQETFKRVHEKAHTFRGTQLKSWLFTIATRVAIDNLRRNKHIRLLSLNQQADCSDEACEQLETLAVADNSCEPSQEVVLTEQKEQVRQAIESLPARQRATLVLAYYQELSYREVAEVLGCSIGTVKAQMSRALRTLARRLPDLAGDIK